ncbi:MAG: serine/threonine protein kinase [Lysobacterales bacterium]
MNGKFRFNFETGGALGGHLFSDLLSGSSDAIELPAGTRLGAWTLLERIGSGGSGTVFRAVRKESEVEQHAAIKVVRKAAIAHERFQREMEVVASLNHPYIVSLIEAGQESEEILWFAMGYVEGTPLNRYSAENRPGWREQLRFFDELCSAVEYAHARLIIHRDLKPANIIVDTHQHPRLLDFGIAFNPACEDVPDRHMTPGYASPEQLQGGEITTLSDIYQLGLILRELLAETSPREPMPELTRRDLAAIVRRATQVAPEDRYRAVSDLRADLSRVIQGRPLLADSGKLRSSLSHFFARNLVTSLLALAASTLIISLIVFFTIRLTAERDIALQNEKRASNVLAFLVKTLTQADPFSASSTPTAADAQPLTVAAAMDRAVSALVDDKAMAAGDRVMLEATLASIFYSLGDTRRCLALIASSPAEPSDLPALDFPAVYRLSVQAECAFSAGDLPLAEQAAKTVIDAHRMESAFSRERMGASMLIKGMAEYRRGDVAAAEATFASALKFAETNAIPVLELEVLRQMTGKALTFRRPQAHQLAERTLAATERLAGRESLRWVQGSMNLAIAQLFDKDLSAAEITLTEAQSVVTAIDASQRVEIPAYVRTELADTWGSLYFQQGRYAECAAKGHEALSHVQNLETYGSYAYNAAWNTARCEVRLEHWQEAEAMARTCWELAATHMQGNSNVQANIKRFLAYAYLRQNRLDEARSDINDALELSASATQPVVQISLSVWLTDAVIAKAEGNRLRSELLTLMSDLGLKSFAQDRIPPGLVELRSQLRSNAMPKTESQSVRHPIATP